MCLVDEFKLSVVLDPIQQDAALLLIRSLRERRRIRG